MTILSCYVDDDTLRDLQLASEQTGRKIEELAEAAIQSAAIEFRVSQPNHQALTKEQHDAKHRRSLRAMP